MKPAWYASHWTLNAKSIFLFINLGGKGGFTFLLVQTILVKLTNLSSFGATDLASYFESIGEEFSEQSWYSDLTSFAGLGEDPYPSAVDTLGALTGGELVNGTEEDFVPIE